MNQILVTSLKKNRKKFYKMQLIISLILMIVLIAYLIYDSFQKNELNMVSISLNKNLKIAGIYNVEKTNFRKKFIFGKNRNSQNKFRI